MPTLTFYNLADEKKKKIIQAAKKEFSRVPMNEASIKNIVDEAGISRGSFYQYFDSKEDLLDYVFEDMGNFKDFIQNLFQQEKIDIFEVNKAIFDYFIELLYIQDNIDFAKKLFHNMKVSELDFLRIHQSQDECMSLKMEKFLDKIDRDKLRINSREDLERLNKILLFFMRGTLATSFSFPSKEEAKKEYYISLEMIKHAFEKEERK